MAANLKWLWRATGREAPPDLEALDLDQAWQRAAREAGLEGDALALRVAEALGLPPLPAEVRPPPSLQRLDPELCRRHACVVLEEGEDRLVVATALPGERELAGLLRFATGLEPVVHIAAPARIRAWQAGFDAPPGEGEVLSDQAASDDGEAVQFVATLLGEAVRAGASDIHLQPRQGQGVVRLRVDGLLRDHATLPGPLLERVVGRFKAVSLMDPAKRRVPQDGRCTARIADRSWDLRLSTLPVDGGERLVIRLLGAMRVTGLEGLGLDPDEIARARAAFRAGAGLFVITGPTGAGKTTTLYGALQELHRPELALVTVEDPIEYRLAGVSQCEVEPAVGLDFAAAVRQLMRQDPDVILIGEIRDEATAEAAFRAALTGHRVLTTLHAGDAMGAIARLRDLGLRPRLMGDALAAVSAQRLLRRLCPECAVPAGDTPDGARFATLAGAPPARAAVGCGQCGGTGYRGRFPVLEVVALDPALRRLVDADAAHGALLDAARATGAPSLGERVADRIRRGDTSLEEGLRVLGGQLWTDLGRAARPPAGPPESA